METFDTYCLVPADVDLADLLEQLFDFVGVVYHADDDVDHPIGSGAEAAAAFGAKLRDGEFVRFRSAKAPDTSGGWLYRLDDGAAVVGLSGAADRPRAALSHLQRLVPGAMCIEYGDQPPPDTASHFERVWRSIRERESGE